MIKDIDAMPVMTIDNYEQFYSMLLEQKRILTI